MADKGYEGLVFEQVVKRDSCPRSSGSRSGSPECRRSWRGERSALGCCFEPCSGRSSWTRRRVRSAGPTTWPGPRSTAWRCSLRPQARTARKAVRILCDAGGGGNRTRRRRAQLPGRQGFFIVNPCPPLVPRPEPWLLAHARARDLLRHSGISVNDRVLGRHRSVRGRRRPGVPARAGRRAGHTSRAAALCPPAESGRLRSRARASTTTGPDSRGMDSTLVSGT